MLIRLLLLFFALQGLIEAHQTGLSYVNLQVNQDNTIDVMYKKPLSDLRGGDITIHYPPSCVQHTPIVKHIENGFIIRTSQIYCGTNAMQNQRIWVEGLVLSDRGVLIRYQHNTTNYKSLLRATTPFMNISKKSTKLQLFFEYIQLGIIHILTGFDHLSFVTGLLILAASLRKLLFTISAFTLSHSITLALGVLGTITINTYYVEAMIALSILFLAKEIMLKRDTFTKQHLGVVAFIFGLVHGLGFSSNLTAIGLPHNEIPLSLFSFNLGIEFGQIIYILIASVILKMLQHFISKALLNKMVAYTIGTLSSFWLLQRFIF